MIIYYLLRFIGSPDKDSRIRVLPSFVVLPKARYGEAGFPDVGDLIPDAPTDILEWLI